MDTKAPTSRTRLGKAEIPSLPEHGLPPEAFIAVLESDPPPTSHFGCVDWYMYEDATDARRPALPSR